MVEKTGLLGGQYGSYEYGNAGYFDYGIHLYYQTGRPEIDGLFADALPDKDWIVLENCEKDIAGIYFNGRLQTDTPYIDLRNLPPEEWKRCVADLFMALRTNVSASATVYDYALSRFGAAITDGYFDPIFHKLYGFHARDLDVLATMITPINRVALFDAKDMQDLMQSEKIRERIAFPDQFGIAQRFRKNYYPAMYPKKYGFKRVIDALRSQLESDGVEIYTDAEILSLECQGGVRAAIFRRANEERRLQDIHSIIWSAGLPALCPLLPGGRPEIQGYDPSPSRHYVNMFVSGDVHMDRLYYFYCFDPGFNTFRVSNHANFCADAVSQRGVPLCVEYWPTNVNHSAETIGVAAAEELERMGILEARQITWSQVEKMPGGGMPLPTLKNMASINSVRNHVLHNKPDNLIVVGTFSSDREFFLRDILDNAFGKLEKLEL